MIIALQRWGEGMAEIQVFPGRLMLFPWERYAGAWTPGTGPSLLGIFFRVLPGWLGWLIDRPLFLAPQFLLAVQEGMGLLLRDVRLVHLPKRIG